MRRRTRRGRRNRRQRKGGFTRKAAVYAGALSLCAAGLGYAVIDNLSTLTPDAMGCYATAHPRETFVFFDASEPRFNEEQARSLHAYFDGLYANLALNERVRFYTTEGDQVASIPTPRFSVCGRARTPQALEDIGAAAANAGYPRKQKQRFLEKIYAPQLSAMFALTANDRRAQAYQSPILETLQAISRVPGFKPGSRLVIVSDLLQNSDSAQFCRTQGHMPRYARFKKRPVYARIRPLSMEGIETDVLLLQRQGFGHPQGLRYCSGEDELRRFWQDFLSDHGASVRFLRIRDGSVQAS